jgi:site-specific recombinase XerD
MSAPKQKDKIFKFQITEFKNKTSTAWRVTGYWPDGNRERKNFKNKTDATEYLTKIESEAEGRKNDYQLTRTSLSRDQLVEAESATKLADGSSICEIITHYKKLEAAVKQQANLTLDQAVAFFEKHYRPEIEELTVYTAQQRFLSSRVGIREKTLTHYKNTTRLLVAKNPERMLHHFTVHDIEKLLRPYKNPNSYLTYRRGISGFFIWAVKNHHCLENPCTRLDSPPQTVKNIAILSPEEIKRLLKAATVLDDGVAVASVCIPLFAGLRPSELEELTPKSIKTERIRIDGGKMSKLKEATKAKRWVNDILRHTSISYQLERDQDEPRTPFNNGTSTQMINQHYRDVIDDPEVIDEFWELTPEAVEQVKDKIEFKGKRIVEWPTDAQLKKLVWAKPLSRLAIDLDVSDSAIRKRCKQHDIELPKNGHWQRGFQRTKSGLKI